MSDALALEHASESDRAAYGRTVLKLVERWAMPSRLAGAVGILEERRALERRVRAIARFRPRQPAYFLVATLWMTLAAVTLTDGRESTLSTASNINPALLYQRAVLLMGDFSEEVRVAMFASPYRDLDWTSKNTDRLAALYDDSFDLLRQAVASRAPCDWGPTPVVRPETLQFWHARIKSLVQLARFRARYHLEHHRPDEAAADLLATWVLARHLPTTQMLFSVLVGISLEALLDTFVAEHFHMFDDASLRQLARGIQSLPDPGPVPDRTARGQPPSADTDGSPVDPNVEAVAHAAVAHAHHQDLRIAVRRQMILAAISYRLGGAAAFEEVRDPAGSGPFQIRRVVVEGVDRGFSLESVLDQDAYREQLVFVEQPGPCLFVHGLRAGQLKPLEQGFEALMRERYGMEPGAVVPPDETTPGDLEVEEDNLDEARRRAWDGKLLYEMGKLDEAEAELRRALQADPDNQDAHDILRLLADTREGRAKTQAIRAELHRIILDEVMFDNLTLPEVLEFLEQVTIQHDPKDVGVRFRIAESSVVYQGPWIDSQGQITPRRRVDPIDLTRVTIRIMPPQHNLRLISVLDAITSSASEPIRYWILESGILFFQAPDVEPRQLEPRIFRVEANALSEKFRDVEVSFSGAHAGPTGEIEPHPGVVLPPYVDPHAAGRLGDRPIKTKPSLSESGGGTFACEACDTSRSSLRSTRRVALPIDPPTARGLRIPRLLGFERVRGSCVCTASQPCSRVLPRLASGRTA